MAIEPMGVGKVVTDLADSSVGKALLVPAATSIGQYLGERTEAWVQHRREKRLRNIEAHVHSFERTFEKDPFETSDDKGLFEWLEGVANIDPEDTELSEVWQAALGRLADGGARRRRLLELAKKLSDEDAGFVHRLAERNAHLGKSIGMSNQRALKGRLVQAGILLPDSEALFAVARVLAILTSIWAFVLVGNLMFLLIMPSFSNWAWLALFVSGVIAAVCFGVLQSRGYFTEDAKELVAWVRRVQQAN